LYIFILNNGPDNFRIWTAKGRTSIIKFDI